jgi:hypothetical protein
VRAQRQSDAPPDDVYYYGIVKPTDTFFDYCASGCTTGLGYIALEAQPSARAAVGIAYGDEISTTTMAHELGHNHGRQHSPCSVGTISGVDPFYPYEGGFIGSWGDDPRAASFIEPGQATDVMGYCHYKWVSDYTYRALANRSARVNSAAHFVEDPRLVLKWRVALLAPHGVRWGVPFSEAAAPFGAPESADVLDASGSVVERVTVYRTTVADNAGFTVVVPPPQSGWHSLRIDGAPPIVFSAPVSVPPPP